MLILPGGSDAAAGVAQAPTATGVPAERRPWALVLAPSLSAVVFVVCLALGISLGSKGISGDGDTARHLVIGQHILATHAIPDTNIWSYALANHTFLDHEWLSEVLTALAYAALGFAGVALLHGAVIALSFSVLVRHMQARGAPVLLAVLVAVVAALESRLHWLARPHVFSFLGLALLAFLLDGWRSGRLRARWLWAVPPIMCLWANLHGGFLYGFAMLAAYLAADALAIPGGAPEARQRLRLLVPVSIVALAATAINPHGVQLLLHIPEYVHGGLAQRITEEYRAPDFHDTTVLPFFATLLVLVLALCWSRRRPTLVEGFLLAGFLVLAFQAVRSVPLFAIVTAPLLASVLAGLAPPLDTSRGAARLLGGVGRFVARRNAIYTRMDARASAVSWPLAGLVGLVLVAAVQQRAGTTPLGIQVDPTLMPVEAAAYLREEPPAGSGLNTQHWGGYLLYALGPDYRDFIDGELSANADNVLGDYLDVMNLKPGWQGLLDKYGVQWAVLEGDSRLAQTLATTPGWREAHRDSLAVVLVKQEPA